MSVMGVCVVGAGDMGTRHAKHWASLADARPVVICDIDETRGRKLADELGCAYESDYRRAIEHEGVDIVSVCIPTYLHPEVSLYGLTHGKHVLCEKPIALSMTQAQAVIDTAKKTGLHLGLGLMRRFGPELQKIEELVHAGVLGGPLVYRDITYNELRPKRAMHGKYMNGGPVIDFCVHLFDTWTRVFRSQPVEVYAQGSVFAEGREEVAAVQPLAIDTASFVVKYASGDVASMSMSWGLPPGVKGRSSWDLIGPKGALYHGEGGLVLDKGAGQIEKFPLPKLDWYLVEIEQFLKEIKDGVPQQVSTGEEARDALKVALAILHSIETGQPVQFDQFNPA